ncbi:hypothetical protein LTR53_017885 [Teratosphaeriaceae sp. CCFEE 6253]|nr:hypothetical protein LTR53_017885 [Teratosphaeriaceae sp. CCFEE 6253]
MPPTTPNPATPQSALGSTDITTPTNSASADGYFDEDLEEHPENHFLSVHEYEYEYEDWASDSEADDGDEVDWNAGITDFALFPPDGRKSNTPAKFSPQWADFVSSQHDALQRSLARTRAADAPDTTKPPLPFDALPGLTPDTSPDLRDDLDAESMSDDDLRAPGGYRVPSFLTVSLTPPSPDEQSVGEEDDLPLFMGPKRAGVKRHPPRKPQRPGLRHSRTLSGKLHSWRRPSWGLWSVSERPEAERAAERAGLDG